MDEINPYQSPMADIGRQSPGVGVWRKGSRLVVHRDAIIPAFCVKTDYPAEQRVPVSVHRGFVFDDGFTVEVPVCDDWWRLRTQLNWVRGALIAILIGSFFGVFVLPSWLAVGGWLPGLSMVACVASLIGLSLVSAVTQFVTVSHSTQEYVYLTGACDDFLDRLPVWPG